MEGAGDFPSTFNHLEKGMATHSSILAWRISWTEKSGGKKQIQYRLSVPICLAPSA